MSTGAIIAIVAGAVILLILLLAVLMPRMRDGSRRRQLEARRGELASEHREAAAEQAVRARAAEGEAKRAQAEAELHQARAEMHDRGLADEEIDGNRDGDLESARGLDGARGETGASVPEERPAG